MLDTLFEFVKFLQEKDPFTNKNGNIYSLCIHSDLSGRFEYQDDSGTENLIFLFDESDYMRQIDEYKAKIFN